MSERTSRHGAVPCYTRAVVVSATPSQTSASVIDSGASPDRPGASSSSDPGPEFCMRPRRPIGDRFWEKVDKSGPVRPGIGTSCWLWMSTKHPNGYGHFTVSVGSKEYAHRMAWALVNGPIPNGLHIDHLCRVRRCVNPAHLEAVTQTENNRRTKVAACRKGHPMAGSNVSLRTNVDGTVSRRCRECNLAWRRAHQIRST